MIFVISLAESFALKLDKTICPEICGSYSNSTKPNQFGLEIILCRIRGAFDYLMCPYYPAYMG